mgnify:CR=1 FL=1
MQGLGDLMRKLREGRRQQLERFNLSGVMDGVTSHPDASLPLAPHALAATRAPHPAAPKPTRRLLVVWRDTDLCVRLCVAPIRSASAHRLLRE